MVNTALPHAYVVISDPIQNPVEVLCTNFSTYDPHAGMHDVYNDPACLINVGEYPFITATSCVVYGCAQTPSICVLDQKLGRSHIRMMEPVSGDLLARIRDGADKSEHILPIHWDMLVDQGLI